MAANEDIPGVRRRYRICPNEPDETWVHKYEAVRPGPTTMIVAGLHGDEESGWRAADKMIDWRVETGRIVVIPRASARAVEKRVRGLDSDPNRDYPPTGECYTEIAREIWGEVERYDPDLLLSLHSSYGIYKSGDGGVGQAIFPTQHGDAREMSQKTCEALNRGYGLDGKWRYRLGNTLSERHTKLMHRAGAQLNTRGVIAETTEKWPSLEDQMTWQRFTVRHLMQQIGHRKGLYSE
ncbi:MULTISPECIES: succinylglutamate desuccinylase/aspartoacylase family protein [unclassified Haladaptatus]|uniref:succinylglutamate desuccinylase/aspartoacylase domain-containing protein n=1 Tax=unclassified Haladaptatus TaxID=2622732 RepID=UPI0023E8B84D|nr:MULTISPECIES: succinylglutamate desuccinylase/aspartoacylase family protein [unclassified Haladaptatus]